MIPAVPFKCLLQEMRLPIDAVSVPRAVRSFLREANRRIDRFQRLGRVPGFVPSDFERTYCVLRALGEANLAPGNLFCEWGSGFGVVTCLAAMLDFDACGIEIAGELVDEAQTLADDFDLPVEFIHGSFIPKGGAVHECAGTGFSWLTTDDGNTHEELDLAPDDFHVIFSYPWPDEEAVIGYLFERFASVAAVLLTYHGGEEFLLRRKRPRKG